MPLQPYRGFLTTWCVLAGTAAPHRCPHCHSFKQVSVWDTAIGFAKSEMLPHAKLWDEKEIFPTEVLKKAGELGFGSIYCRYCFVHTAPAHSASCLRDKLHTARTTAGLI